MIISHPSSKASSGFTIIEMAIVITVMGLILLVVMAGKSLMDSAKLQAVITQVREYAVAIHNFEAHYHALPGDIDNASSFWGSASNGDKSGKIDTTDEAYDAWHHLSLSQMISGTYSGSGTDAAIGTNVPASRYMLAGYYLAWVDSPGSYTDNQGSSFSNHYLLFGREAEATGGTDLLTLGAISPPDAMYVDMKIDNEEPDYGLVLSVNGDGVTDCVSSGAYDLSNTGLSCIMYFAITPDVLD